VAKCGLLERRKAGTRAWQQLLRFDNRGIPVGLYSFEESGGAEPEPPSVAVGM
jgi:hypothetical protein